MTILKESFEMVLMVRSFILIWGLLVHGHSGVSSTSAKDILNQKSMNQESMRTAYVYLNWYVANLQKNKLTESQKKQIEELKKQIDADFNKSNQKEIDTHSLWQKLGELERTLSVVSKAVDMKPLPMVFSGVEPMSITNLSVSTPKRHVPRNPNKEEDDLPPSNELIVITPGVKEKKDELELVEG